MSKHKDMKTIKEVLLLSKNIETFFEKNVTKFGNSAKIDAPKVYIGKRTYVIVFKH
ncbi:MAG: DUF2080 family transposase-associated protein [Candidatus Marsarchaeota archaeon]|nr:DUF2080 family transposase-associated protein [Candidatus Marsarchaeota archaeon]MCL5094638.1 DUF2080 family transposase-associated protein [Candidatus Marsarchaeota archaeon]